MKKTVLILYCSPESKKSIPESVEIIKSKNTEFEFITIAAHNEVVANEISFYQNFKYYNNPESPEDINHYVFEKLSVDPAYLYESDQDYIYKQQPQDYFLHKTFYTLRKFVELKESKNLHCVFMTGGGNLFTNTAFTYFNKINGIKVRRIPPFHYLNYNPSYVRLGMINDNLYNITKDKLDAGVEPWAKQMAIEYIDKVKNRKLSLDRDARKIAAAGTFCPNNIYTAGMFAIKVLIKWFLSLFEDHPVPYYFENKEKVKAYWNKRLFDFKDMICGKVKISDEPYFIQVLHHPVDSQITFRGRAFRDQIALARMIARSLPAGTQLLVKEHPVYPGSNSFWEVQKLQKDYPQVKFLNYKESMDHFLPNSSGLITVNSTAGIEAAIREIPVILLGNCFYSQMKDIYKVSSFNQLNEILNQCIHEPKVPQKEDVEIVLASLINMTYPKRESTSEDKVPLIFAEAVLSEI